MSPQGVGDAILDEVPAKDFGTQPVDHECPYPGLQRTATRSETGP